MSRRRATRDMTVYPDSTLGERMGDAGLGSYKVDPAEVQDRAGDRPAHAGLSIVEQLEVRAGVLARRILEEESEQRVALLKRELVGVAYGVVAMRQPFAGMVGPVAASKWAKAHLKAVREQWLTEEG